jgi:SAM-dependent methyltransferase
MPASKYREHFQQPETASSYVETYTGSTYDALLWEIEREQITELVSRHAAADGLTVDCATGTGRVLSVLEDIRPRVLGVDSSGPMLAVARERCQKAELIQADLLEGLPMLEEEAVSLITAFRLLLNIDPQFRGEILAHFARALKHRPDGLLLVNNHGSTPSVKSVRRKRSQARGTYETAGNVLARSDLETLFAQSGWEIAEVAGSGFLGGRVAQVVGPTITARIERWVAERPRLARLGTNQIYALRLAA